MIGRPSRIEELACRVYEVISCSEDDMDYLAIMCDVGTSTTGVKNSIRWLELHGWIEVRRSRGKINQYIPKRRIQHYQPSLIIV